MLEDRHLAYVICFYKTNYDQMMTSTVGWLGVLGTARSGGFRYDFLVERSANVNEINVTDIRINYLVSN